MTNVLREAGAKGIGFILIAISTGLALIWIAFAAYVWLGSIAGSAWAALIVGAALLLPATVFLFATRVAKRAEAHAEATLLARPHEDEGDLRFGAIADRLVAITRERPVAMLAVTVIAGVVLARYPAAAASLARMLARD